MPKNWCQAMLKAYVNVGFHIASLTTNYHNQIINNNYLYFLEECWKNERIIFKSYVKSLKIYYTQ